LNIDNIKSGNTIIPNEMKQNAFSNKRKSTSGTPNYFAVDEPNIFKKQLLIIQGNNVGNANVTLGQVLVYRFQVKCETNITSFTTGHFTNKCKFQSCFTDLFLQQVLLIHTMLASKNQ
jgi:hypothetical protein